MILENGEKFLQVCGIQFPKYLEKWHVTVHIVRQRISDLIRSKEARDEGILEIPSSAKIPFSTDSSPSTIFTDFLGRSQEHQLSINSKKYSNLVCNSIKLKFSVSFRNRVNSSPYNRISTSLKFIFPYNRFFCSTSFFLE